MYREFSIQWSLLMWSTLRTKVLKPVSNMAQAPGCQILPCVSCFMNQNQSEMSWWSQSISLVKGLTRTPHSGLGWWVNGDHLTCSSVWDWDTLMAVWGSLCGWCLFYGERVCFSAQPCPCHLRCGRTNFIFKDRLFYKTVQIKMVYSKICSVCKLFGIGDVCTASGILELCYWQA